MEDPLSHRNQVYAKGFGGLLYRMLYLDQEKHGGLNLFSKAFSTSIIKDVAALVVECFGGNRTNSHRIYKIFVERRKSYYV